MVCICANGGTIEFIIERIMVFFDHQKQQVLQSLVYMTERPLSHTQVQYLRAKRKEILKSRGRSSEHSPHNPIKYRVKQSDPSQDKQAYQILYTQLIEKQKQIDELQEKNRNLNQDVQALQAYIHELQCFIQLSNKNNRSSKKDCTQNCNNLVFSFKMDNRDSAQKKQNVSYDKHDKTMGLQSTEIYPSANFFPYPESPLKTQSTQIISQIKGIYTQNRSGGGLLKIPEEPEKELKKAKSESHIKQKNKLEKKNPDHQQKKLQGPTEKEIGHLKKKILKLQKQNHQLSKECKTLKELHKHRKGFIDGDIQTKEGVLSEEIESMRKKIKKYENLIEKQQKQMQKIISLCQEDIEQKNKQISQITANFLERKIGFQRVIDKLTEEKSQYSFNLHQYEERIKYLQEKNKNLSLTLEKVKKELLKREGVSTALEQKIKELMMNNKSLAKEQDFLKTTIAEMQKHPRHKFSDDFMDSSLDRQDHILIVNGKRFKGNGEVVFNTQF